MTRRDARRSRLEWTIFSVAGIPVRVHVTLLAFLPLLAWFISTAVPTLTELPFVGADAGAVAQAFGGYGNLAAGAAIAVFLFGSVLLHELGHVWVARRNGLPVRAITLWIFGGISQIDPEKDPRPAVEARMAFAGPLVSFLLGGIGVGARLVLTGDPWLGFVVAYLAYLNIILGAFNLVPAFPLDGGRLLRAALATRMSHPRATRAAANVGKALAVVMGFIGLFVNVFLLFIAFFVYMGANQEANQVEVTAALEPIKVAMIMERDPPTVAPDVHLDDLVARMLTTHHIGFPVLVDDRVEGVVSLTDVRGVPQHQRATTRVADVMTRDLITVEPEAPATDALRLMAERGVGRLVVLERDGTLQGVVTREHVLKAFEIAKAHPVEDAEATLRRDRTPDHDGASFGRRPS